MVCFLSRRWRWSEDAVQEVVFQGNPAISGPATSSHVLRVQIYRAAVNGIAAERPPPDCR